MTSSYTRLVENLDALRLNTIKSHLEEGIEYATSNQLSLTDALLHLTDYEVEQRKENAIKAMVKVGAFPFHKSLKDFDFDFQPSINKSEIQELDSLGFIERGENIVFLGPSGVGKTHLATSIGISAAQRRYCTYFIKCNDLIAQLRKAKLENRLEDRIKHFNKYRLLILDELGYLPIDKEDAKLFFQLIDKRYEKKSIIITTNINFSQWDEIFGEVMIANAILDRVLHHAKVVRINGKSYRLKDYFNTNDKEADEV